MNNKITENSFIEVEPGISVPEGLYLNLFGLQEFIRSTVAEEVALTSANEDTSFSPTDVMVNPADECTHPYSRGH
jgi:hypothetical protein